MLEKLRNLSGKAKAGIAAGLALLAAAGVGLGVWQPWNQTEEPPQEPDQTQQEPQLPQTPPEKPEEQLSLQVEGEMVPCTLYEGDGWSIYVPEGWTAAKEGANGARLSSGDGAQMSVAFQPGSDYAGQFVNLSAADGGARQLQFYSGAGESSPDVRGSAPGNKWDNYDKLFVALARSLKAGGENPFSTSYIIPQEPDWQEAEGSTVLFLDKDGLIIDDQAQEAVERYMSAWPEADRASYTGQYRINGIDWAGTYSGIVKAGYIDVFRVRAQYRVAEGGEEALKAQNSAVKIVDGWAGAPEDVYLAVFNDGGAVDKTQALTAPAPADWAALAVQLS